MRYLHQFFDSSLKLRNIIAMIKEISDMGFLGITRNIDDCNVVDVKVMETGAFVGVLEEEEEGIWKVRGANDFPGDGDPNKKILEKVIETARGNYKGKHN